jgi:arylformamidase
MCWIDVSLPVRTGMLVYEGDPVVRIERVSSVEDGDLADLSRIEMGSHTGTHVDAPSHVLPGAAGVDELPLDALVGAAWVADVRDAPGDIDAGAIARAGVPEDVERLLLRTRNEGLWEAGRFVGEYVGVTEDGARELVRRGVRLVGIDYLSIAPSADPLPAHHVLLGARVVVLESLDLRGVDPGAYRLVCLPLRLAGADGAPARALIAPM